MDNGVNVTDAGTLAALRGVGLGYSHGNFLGDGSAVASKIDCNNSTLRAGLVSADLDRKDTNSEIRTTDLDNHIRDLQTQNLTLALNQQGQISDLANSNMRTALENQINTQGIVQRIQEQLAACCCENRVANERINAKIEAVQMQMAADRQQDTIDNLRSQISRNDVNGETVAILNAINNLGNSIEQSNSSSST